MFNGKNHNKTITFLYIICVVFSLLNWYNISKKTKGFLIKRLRTHKNRVNRGYRACKNTVLIDVTKHVKNRINRELLISSFIIRRKIWNGLMWMKNT